MRQHPCNIQRWTKRQRFVGSPSGGQHSLTSLIAIHDKGSATNDLATPLIERRSSQAFVDH